MEGADASWFTVRLDGNLPLCLSVDAHMKRGAELWWGCRTHVSLHLLTLASVLLHGRN